MHSSATVAIAILEADHREPEAVHADDAAAFQETREVVEVRRVAHVTDQHARQIDAFLLEDVLLIAPGLGRARWSA